MSIQTLTVRMETRWIYFSGTLDPSMRNQNGVALISSLSFILAAEEHKSYFIIDEATHSDSESNMGLS